MGNGWGEGEQNSETRIRVGTSSLRATFSKLFNLYEMRDVSLQKMGIWSYLHLIILNVFLTCSYCRRWVEMEAFSRGMFATEKVYELVSNSPVVVQTSQGGTNEFCHISGKINPIKVGVMAQRLLWDRLPTNSNLIRRSVLQENCNSNCSLCNTTTEMASHLFFDCAKSLAI